MCAIVGVPRQGPVSAHLAWGDSFVKNMLTKVLKRLSLLRHHGTPMMARLQLPESPLQRRHASRAFEIRRKTAETQELRTPGYTVRAKHVATHNTTAK